MTSRVVAWQLATLKTGTDSTNIVVHITMSNIRFHSMVGVLGVQTNMFIFDAILTISEPVSN